MTETIKRPVQKPPSIREASKIADSVHLAAYEVYCEVYGPQPALLEGWCRGGFGCGELIAYLFARSFPKSEWKQRVREAMAGNVNL